MKLNELFPYIAYSKKQTDLMRALLSYRHKNQNFDNDTGILPELGPEVLSHLSKVLRTSVENVRMTRDDIVDLVYMIEDEDDPDYVPKDVDEDDEDDPDYEPLLDDDSEDAEDDEEGSEESDAEDDEEELEDAEDQIRKVGVQISNHLRNIRVVLFANTVLGFATFVATLMRR